MKLMKLYWVFCGAIFFIGVGMAIFAAEFPDTTASGEMPPVFGAGVTIALLAVVGFAVGVSVKVVLSFIKHRYHQ